MKSIVINAAKTTYPCLKINKNGMIVLFNSQNCGMIIKEGLKNSPLGYYSTAWLEEEFVPFVGTIELSN